MNKTPYPGQQFAAFLFDMDGTILTSIAAAERVWTAWAVRHGLDVAKFLPTIHGKRAIDTVRGVGLAGIDPVAEAAQITRDEILDVRGIDAIVDAARFLASLPPERWTIVTSAPRELALRRLEAAGLPVPPQFVTSEDIPHGKPAPDCFLLGAKHLGVNPKQCLVFEDAPAGIAAAEAAGASVVVVTATHTHPFTGSHATLPDYTGLSAKLNDAGLLTLVPQS